MHSGIKDGAIPSVDFKIGKKDEKPSFESIDHGGDYKKILDLSSYMERLCVKLGLDAPTCHYSSLLLNFSTFQGWTTSHHQYLHLDQN